MVVTIVRSLQNALIQMIFLPLLAVVYQTYLIPKFILAMHFSFGNTSGKRLVNAVNFIPRHRFFFVTTLVYNVIKSL